jgi:hypothetical protein
MHSAKLPVPATPARRSDLTNFVAGRSSLRLISRDSFSRVPAAPASSSAQSTSPSSPSPPSSPHPGSLPAPSPPCPGFFFFRADSALLSSPSPGRFFEDSAVKTGSNLQLKG